MSENSMINVLKFRKLISLSESGSQKVRIRFTESGFGIRHYKSNQICSLLLVTDGYRSLQVVTARYRSLLLIPSFSNNETPNVVGGRLMCLDFELALPWTEPLLACRPSI